MIRRHVPWTRWSRSGGSRVDGQAVDLVPHLRAHRDQFVIKPNDEYGGTGVTLGWETSERDVGRGDRARARASATAAGSRRSGSPSAAKCFRSARRDGDRSQRDMLVDFAPYLFRGKLAGFLTRLSATGLANVTSGGGQVPAFVVNSEVRRSEARSTA